MASYHQPYPSGFVAPPPSTWVPQSLPQAHYAHPVQNQQPAANGPPFKKQKGNPVITKYPPPPPGWKPPIHASGYQPPMSGYDAGQNGIVPASAQYYPAQPSQQTLPPYQPPVVYAYTVYQAQPDQSYQQPAVQVDPTQAYQPFHSPADARAHAYPYYQQPQPYQPAQLYPASTAVLQPSPQAGYFDSVSDWQTSQVEHTGSIPPVPYPIEPGLTALPSDEDHVALRQASTDDCVDEFDFDGESLDLTDEIDPRFSLGLIVWHPAVERKRPLPSTFEEAELEAEVEAPTATQSAQDEDVSSSKYFGSGEQDFMRSVRDTDEWNDTKHDLIFVEFEDNPEVVPLATVIANRYRPDNSADEDGGDSDEKEESTISTGDKVQERQPSFQSHIVSQPQGDIHDESDGDQAMDMSEDDDEDSHDNETKSATSIAPDRGEEPKPVTVEKGRRVAQPSHRHSLHGRQTHIIESLERSISPAAYQTRSRPPPTRQTRSRSPEKLRNRQGSQQPRRKPKPHPKDPTQESVLAALGVEGLPKTVYPTPPPALGPPASPERNGSRSPDKFGNRRDPPYHPLPVPLSYGPHFPPPPPPPQRSPSYDPWKAHDIMHGNPRRTRSPSITSQHTAAGSDFHSDDRFDMDATPKAKQPVPPPPPPHARSDGPGSGRKRTFDHMAEAESDKRRRQLDDTPKARRKPNYDRTDAYSRRW
ncbi:hypothetical protein AAFC00_006876 [Neodothiora populina]|uniref:Uncharacterized protein n=1 Tax=Neodothiora populina TaxID=2781224 RepID=A0ABR3PBP5_9PEZI